MTDATSDIILQATSRKAKRATSRVRFDSEIESSSHSKEDEIIGSPRRIARNGSFNSRPDTPAAGIGTSYTLTSVSLYITYFIILC